MRRDGSAITMRITAGMIVQTISISWASIVLVLESLVVIKTEMIYKTSILIKSTAMRAWS